MTIDPADYFVRGETEMHRAPDAGGGETATAGMFLSGASTPFPDGSGVQVGFDALYGPDAAGYADLGISAFVVPAGMAGRHKLWATARLAFGSDGTTPDRTDAIALIYDVDDFTVYGYTRLDMYDAPTNDITMLVHTPVVELAEGVRIGLGVQLAGLSTGPYPSGSTGTGGTDSIGGAGGGGNPFTFLSIERIGS